jgi:hypothetical protein
MLFPEAIFITGPTEGKLTRKVATALGSGLSWVMRRIVGEIAIAMCVLQAKKSHDNLQRV